MLATTMDRESKRSRPDPRSPAGPNPVVVGFAFAVLALAVYAPALDGPFFSDDQHYVERNAYIQNPSVASWIEIWSPTVSSSSSSRTGRPCT